MKTQNSPILQNFKNKLIKNRKKRQRALKINHLQITETIFQNMESKTQNYHPKKNNQNKDVPISSSLYSNR